MFLELRGVTKTFPGVVALNRVDIGFAKGEIHALVGENGAGKSTLIKIIGGKYQPDSGEVFYNDRNVRITDPLKALELGISTVYQEYNLIPNLKAIENILLGSEPTAGLWRIDWTEAEGLCRDLMARMDVQVNLHQYASELGAAEAKIVEILKALVARAAVVIMDEPTAALPGHEVDSLFTLIQSLKGSGVTVIYISHRIDEIFAVADRVSVLKDGNMVGTHALKEIDRDRLIKLMIGRELKDIYPPRKAPPGKGEGTPGVTLSVRGLGDSDRLKGITFDLRRGEILGIGGMTGNGQRELIRALFGAHRTTSGRIFFEGKEVEIDSPRKALRLGIGFIPDDRRNEGLAVTQPVRSNIALPSLHLRQRGGIIQGRREKSVVEDAVKTLDIRLTSISQKVQNLSGGNQQRVVIAKWIPLNPKILLFHEPTLGIDVGAKLEIYRLMHRFTELGVSIIMVSSDMMELLNVPDRVLVLFDGSISGEFPRAEASEEAVMYAASGYGKNDEKR
jgi:ribose transport system ATP-binding protein